MPDRGAAFCFVNISFHTFVCSVSSLTNQSLCKKKKKEPKLLQTSCSLLSHILELNKCNNSSSTVAVIIVIAAVNSNTNNNDEMMMKRTTMSRF